MCVTKVVVDEEEVAEWIVDDVEANIRTDLLGISVVLKESIERCGGTNGVEKTGAQQVCCECAIGQADLIAGVVEANSEMIVGPPGQSPRQ